MARTTSDGIVAQNALDYLLYDDLDLERRKFVSWDEFARATQRLAVQVVASEARSGRRFEAIYAIPRGGLILGTTLSYLLQRPLLTDEKHITTHTLIVDDSTNSGATLRMLIERHPGVATLVLFAKPGSAIEPTFVHETTDKQINFAWERREERN